MYRSSMVIGKVLAAAAVTVGGVMVGSWLAGRAMDWWDRISNPWPGDRP